MDDEQYRKCDQECCEFPAQFYYVWTEPHYSCLIHTTGMLNLAAAIGFPTPAATIRELTPDEMIPDTED